MTISVVPANEVSCADLDSVFDDAGPAAECRCQRYRLARRESFANTPVAERRARLHEQTGCGHPAAASTSGLVALVDGEAVGWCAVAPRASYPGLVRNGSMAAWAGREEDRSDPQVWAITCVLVRTGHRRQGVAGALVRVAVDLASASGASRLEAYPIDEPSTVGSENHPGLLSTYLDAGFTLWHRPSKRRTVVAVDLPATARP